MFLCERFIYKLLLLLFYFWRCGTIVHHTKLFCPLKDFLCVYLCTQDNKHVKLRMVEDNK